MSETIARSQIGTVVYLMPSTPLVTPQACADLESTLDECVRAGQFQVVIDLEQVSQIGSRALEILLDGSVRVGPGGGSLRFVNASTVVRNVLVATGLADMAALEDRDVGRLHNIGQHHHHPNGLKFGDILIEMGLVTAEKINEVVAQQARSSKQLGSQLVEAGVLTPAQRLEALSHQLGIPYLALSIGLFEPE